MYAAHVPPLPKLLRPANARPLFPDRFLRCIPATGQTERTPLLVELAAEGECSEPSSLSKDRPDPSSLEAVTKVGPAPHPSPGHWWISTCQEGSPPRPAPHAHQLPVAVPGHPAVYGRLSTGRPAHKCPVTLHLRFATESLRPYSTIPQTLRSFLGILISICRRGHRKKAVMGARTSTTSRSSVSAVDTVTVSVARGSQCRPGHPAVSRTTAQRRRC